MSKRLINCLLLLGLFVFASFEANCQLLNVKYKWNNILKMSEYNFIQNTAVSNDNGMLATAVTADHDDYINIFSSNGKYISTIISDDMNFEICNLTMSACYFPMTFSRDDNSLIFAISSSSNDKDSLGIADVKTGKLTSEFNISSDGIDGLHIQRIFCIDSDNVLIIANNKNCAKIIKMNYHNGDIIKSVKIDYPESNYDNYNYNGRQIIDINRQSNTIAFLTKENNIANYSLSDFSKINEYKTGLSDIYDIAGISLSPNGSNLIVESISADFYCYNNNNGTLLSSVSVQSMKSSEYQDFYFINDHLISFFSNGVIYNIDFESSTINNSTDCFNARAQYVVPMSDKYVILDTGNVAYVLNKDKQKMYLFNKGFNDIYKAQFSYDDKYIAVLSKKTYSNCSGKLNIFTEANGMWIDSVSFDILNNCFDLFKNNYNIVYADTNNRIVISNILNPESKQVVAQFSNTDTLTSLHISKDCQYIICSWKDSTITIWDIVNKTMAHKIQCNDQVLYANFTNTPELMICIEHNNIPGAYRDRNGSGYLCTYDINGQMLYTNQNYSLISPYAFANNIFGANSSSPRCWIWDVSSDYSQIQPITIPLAMMCPISMDMSPDGTYLLSGAAYRFMLLNEIGQENYCDTIQIPSINGKSALSPYTCVFSNNKVNGNYEIFVGESDGANGVYAGILNYDQADAVFENPVSADSYDIYPNPAHDNLNVSNRKSAFVKTITLLDIYGNAVQTETINSSDANNYINLNGVVPGCYFVKIADDTGISMKKVIIY